MARERPTASTVSPKLDGASGDPDPLRLTCAEAAALRRSAPLTHAKLQEHFRALAASSQTVATER